MTERTFDTQTQTVAFHFTVDGEALSTHEHILTPRQIMVLAGIDPATHFITEVRGHEQISFEGKPDEPVRMHNGLVFISSTTGPTPVS